MLLTHGRPTDPDEANNPFHANGELRRKADFIITHSRISRTELQIADPDDVSTAATASHNNRRSGESRDSHDGHANCATRASLASAHDQQTRRHDDNTTVVIVTSSVPLHASTAEKIRIKKKRCVVQ